MPSNHRDFLIDRKGSKIVGIIYFGWNIISILTFFKSFDVKDHSRLVTLWFSSRFWHVGQWSSFSNFHIEKASDASCNYWEKNNNLRTTTTELFCSFFFLKIFENNFTMRNVADKRLTLCGNYEFYPSTKLREISFSTIESSNIP